MATARICGGTAMYGRTVKTGEYENKKAEVTINFDAEEGDATDILNTASTMALAKVHEMLQIKLPASHIPPAAVVAAADGKKRGAGRPSNAERAMQAAVKGLPASNISTGEERKDPAAMDDFEVESKAPIAKTPEVDLDDFGIEVPKQPVISDAEIGSALQRRQGELKDAPRIRALIAKYAPAGANGLHNARDIPQEKRQDFLDELAGLQASAA